MTRIPDYALVLRISRVRLLFLLLPALVVAARSSRCPRCLWRKAGEGLGGPGRIHLGQPVRCLGAGVRVKRVVGDDAAQGLSGPGRIDLGQPVRCLGAGVRVKRVVGDTAEPAD
jgi:hypothetical protein